MPESPLERDEWLLKRGDETLARIVVHGIDQPWFLGRFEPLGGFEVVRGRFERELHVLEQKDWAAFEELWAELRGLGVTLERPRTGEVAGEFLLHIEGEDAWFRY